MPIDLYKDAAASAKAKTAGEVRTTNAVRLDINDPLQGKTLSQIASLVQKQIGLQKGTVGVRLLCIEVALIFDPDDKRETERPPEPGV